MQDRTTSSALGELSDALATAVERAGAYTVRVNARRRMPASGIVWADGVILTADHVIERDEDITVTLPDGSSVAAAVAGRDPGSDLAVLRAQTGLAAATRADGAKVGHLVLALGRGTETGLTAAMGVISAVGGPWQSGRGTTVEGYIRADVTMYPGFFRGLLDARARTVDDEMKVAAARALAGLVAEGELSEEYIVPSVFDRRVAETVSGAVQEVVRQQAP